MFVVQIPIHMKKLFRLFALTCVVFTTSKFHAQENKAPEGVLVYDVVYLKDGRVLKGEILIFEEKDGDITFKDLYGKKYSITREEYTYFVEDKRYFINKNDTLTIRPRKEKEIEINLGFSFNYLVIDQQFTADTNYMFAYNTYNTFVPMCFKLGVGKFLNRQNYVGLSADIPFTSGGANSYFNLTGRYFHQYDAYKRNISFYIPVELGYSRFSFDGMYQKLTSTPWSPENETANHIVSSATFSLGQGVSFILNNKKSVSVELIFIKNYIMSVNYEGLSMTPPTSKYKSNNFKLALFYNI